MKRLFEFFALAAMACAVFVPGTKAADTVRAGKAVDVAWIFTILDIGMDEGIFAKYGINVEIATFLGDAKMQQALAADSVDFGLGSGPAMAFSVKGVPMIAVAAFAAEPRNIAVLVAPDGPIKTVRDLKDKLVSVSSPGSLTEWLVKRLATKEGWGPAGVRTIATGSGAGQLSAFKTHQVDAMMSAAETGFMLEERGEARILTNMGNYATPFITHVVFARTAMVKDHPDRVERFLKGFFATVAFMKTHKERTNAIAQRVLNEPQSVLSKTYDYELSMMEDDGHFDPAAVEVLKDSFDEMHILDHRPANDQLYTTRFVPVRF